MQRAHCRSEADSESQNIKSLRIKLSNKACVLAHQKEICNAERSERAFACSAVLIGMAHTSIENYLSEPFAPLRDKTMNSAPLRDKTINDE